jgi:isochorismate pyruvate lyase
LKRAEDSSSRLAAASLAELRALFDDVDARLLALLAERAHLSRAAGRLKAAAGLPVVDAAREAQAHAQRTGVAKELGLDGALVDDVFAAIVTHSRRMQAPPSEHG